jgi:Ca2+-binding RTX toxin-like protein
LIFGFGGDDDIRSGRGADYVYGGIGKDFVDGGADNDVIYGGDGDDELFGGDGHDRIYGGNHGVPFGSGGADDTDKLYGGAGNDVIWGGEGDDELYGEADDDELRGGAGVDIIHGGDGNDAIYDGLGDDQLFGGDGDDTFYFEGGTNSFDGGAGTDTLSFAESQTGVIILLTPSGQTAYGSNTIANIERLSGSNFADLFDWQDASAPPTGDLSISGGGGDDLIAGGAGSNTLSGGEGNDTFRLLLGGATTIDGGAGVDTVSFDAAAAGVSAVIGDGVLLGPDGFSFDSVENLIGSNYADTIGHDGSDSLVASGGGDDILTIGTGDHPAFLMTGHGEDHVKINSIAYPRETYILDSGAGDRLFDSYHNISINWVIDNAGQPSVDTYDSHTRHQFDINATAFGEISYSVVLSFYNPGYYGQFEGQSGFDRGIVEISYGFGEAHPQENGIMGNFTAVVFDFQIGDFGISLGGYEAISSNELQVETIEFLNVLEAYNDEPYDNVMAAISSPNTWDLMI